MCVGWMVGKGVFLPFCIPGTLVRLPDSSYHTRRKYCKHSAKSFAGMVVRTLYVYIVPLANKLANVAMH